MRSSWTAGGRFLWPSPADGTVAISAAQLAHMLDDIAHRQLFGEQRVDQLEGAGFAAFELAHRMIWQFQRAGHSQLRSATRVRCIRPVTAALQRAA